MIMDISIDEKIKACYLAYINEENVYKKVYYLELLRKYLDEKEEIHDE